MSTGNRYVVVGAGAIGGLIAARLVRRGSSVIACDADRDHVEAMNRHGLRIEGPVDTFEVPMEAVLPENLPEAITGPVILAVKAQHTSAAMDLLAGKIHHQEGFVVSLQNGLTVDAISAYVGASRVVPGMINVSADYLAPGRIFLGGQGTFVAGETNGQFSDRLELLVKDIDGLERTTNICGYRWSKLAYSAILAATAVSGVPIADALAMPRYRGVWRSLLDGVLTGATASLEAFDGFDPYDFEGSLSNMVSFNRKSAKKHSGIYRDLVVRRRPTEVSAQLGRVDSPAVKELLHTISKIERGELKCSLATLDMMAERMGVRL